MLFLLVIVDDLNIRWTNGVDGPFKANAPLLVNANGPLSSPVAFESFQPIAGQSSQIGQRDGSVQNFEAFPALLIEPLKRTNKLAICEFPRARIAVAQDHAIILTI
jgi:hypothetical protein